MDFYSRLLKELRGDKKRIVLPETDAAQVLKGAERLIKLDAVIPVLIGKDDEVKAFAKENGICLDGAEFINPDEEGMREKIVGEYMATGQTFLSEKSIARKIKKDDAFAAALVKIGRCDGMVSGFQCTTAETVFTAQNVIGMKKGISTVSSLCVLEATGWDGPEGDLLCITDCVVTEEPTSEALADIAISACDTMRAMLKWQPRAAMLSYSTCGSGQSQSVKKVTDAVRIANEKRPDLAIDGEFQLDAALLLAVAAKKVKRESKVAGKANIIVFPDLDAGNIGVKLVKLFNGFPDHGALIAGLEKPCADLSRNSSIEQIVGACIMVAATAQGLEV